MGWKDQFDGVVRALAEAQLDDARWPDASRLVDDACGLLGNHLAIVRGRSRQDAEFLFGRLYVHGEPNDELESTYVNNYFAVDERVPRYFDMPDGALARINALVTDLERRNSATYNEFLEPTGGGKSVVVRLDGPEGLHIVWLMAHVGKPDDWCGDQIDRIRSLLTHVRHFVRVRRALAGADVSRARSLLDVQFNGRVGVILLDRWGRIVETNDRARDMLRASSGLSDRRGFLAASCASDTNRLRKLLAKVLPGGSGSAVGGSMPVRRAARPPLALHATPIARHLSDVGPGSIAAVIVVADPLANPGVDAGRLPALLDLTPMQSRVAASLAGGGTVRSTAAAINRTPETVCWHIKQITSRFGLSRQADIVRLVLSTPGV